jgi:hypothetical protein
MCLLLVPALPRVFLWWPLKVLTRQTKQVVCANIQSIFYVLFVLNTWMSMFWTMRGNFRIKFSNNFSFFKQELMIIYC